MNSLTIKDIITVVVLSVLMIFVQFLVSALLAFNLFANMVLCPMVVCLINGPIFVLMAARVRKRGVFLIYTVLVGLAFLLSGYWFVMLYFVVLALLGEFVVMRGKHAYSSYKRIILLWTIYSVFFVGSAVIPVWFMWDSYQTAALNGGFSVAYLATVYEYFTDLRWLVLIAGLALAGGFTGSLFGINLMNKHFIKAGMA